MESDIIRYYEQYDEEGRLTRRRWGQVEYLTTMKYLRKYLRPGDRVLDIGAGTGRYSIALASEGYDVTAVELVEHLAVLDEEHAPGMACRLDGVRDHEDSLTERVHLAEQAQQFVGGLRIERARRLVGKHYFGVVDYGSCDCHALHLTARK